MKIDLSGLHTLVESLERMKREIPELNREFLQEEFDLFLDEVKPLTPVDTGDMVDSYIQSEVRRHETISEVDWSNTAAHSRFANYGTIHQAPRYFFERGMNYAEQGRALRYQEKLKRAFEGGE